MARCGIVGLGEWKKLVGMSRICLLVLACALASLPVDGASERGIEEVNIFVVVRNVVAMHVVWHSLYCRHIAMMCVLCL